MRNAHYCLWFVVYTHSLQKVLITLCCTSIDKVWLRMENEGQKGKNEKRTQTKSENVMRHRQPDSHCLCLSLFVVDAQRGTTKTDSH